MELFEIDGPLPRGNLPLLGVRSGDVIRRGVRLSAELEDHVEQRLGPQEARLGLDCGADPFRDSSNTGDS